MLYEWDTRKDEENRRKRGLRPSDGIPALNDPQQVEWIDDRFNYGEERTITPGRVPCVVHDLVRAGQDAHHLREEGDAP